MSEKREERERENVTLNEIYYFQAGTVVLRSQDREGGGGKDTLRGAPRG
jgi:hypothetical protein